MPHRPDETKVLRNLGFDVPHPIRFYYDWPSKYSDRFNHQEVTAEFLATHTRAFCLSEMGTMKTISSLWAWDYLRSQGLAQKLFVVAPLSGLERAWADEIFYNFPGMSAVVLHGDRKRRLKLLEEDVDVYIINHHGVAIVADAVAKRDDIDSVIVDEIDTLRNAGTQLWKSTRKAITGKKNVWGMTGTPIPNAPTDAWAQCRLIVPERVPPYFGRFRDSVMRQVTQWKWVPRDNALDVVAQAMQPAIRFTRDECLDLPPTTYETREVPLTKEQQHLFDDMKRKLHAEMGDNQITASNEAVKLGKLLQIIVGAVYDNTGNQILVPATERLEETKRVVEQSLGKTIVFVPYTQALQGVAEYLSQFFSVETVHGGVSKHDRDRIFQSFQKEKHPQVLVANSRTMSHSITLTEASTIVWFGPTHSAGTYEQANARAVRQGQKRNTLIVHMESTTLERKVYERLQNKRSTQGLLLQMLKEGV